MAVRKHPCIPGAWQIDWLEPDTSKPVGKRGKHPNKRKYETYVGSLENAHKREAELRLKHSDYSRITLNPPIERILPDYLQWLELHRSPGYYKSMVWALEKIKPHFGRHPVKNITRQLIDDFKAKHRTTPAHCNQCLDYLKIIISWMTQRGHAMPLPFKIEKLPHFRNIPQPPDPEEFSQFFAAVKHGLKEEGISKRERALKEALILVMYETGIRWVEARHLEWQNLHQDGRLYLGRTKTGEARYTVLSKELMTSIEPYRNKKGYIFVNEETKKPYTSIRKLIQGARERSGVTVKGTHGLRHALGSDMIDAGVDLRTIQDVFGHTELKTTQKYTKVSIARKREKLEETRQWRKTRLSTADKK